MMIEEWLNHDMLMKVALFGVVQALVYLILSKSSSIFSENKKMMRSNSSSFKPARSVSIRRMLAVLQDMPSGGESSPSPKDMRRSPTPAPTGDIDDSASISPPAISASASIHHRRQS